MKLQKKNVNRFLGFALAFALVACFSMGLSAEKAPKGALVAAKMGLAKFKSQTNFPKGFPLAGPDNKAVKNVKIGFGFQMFTVNPEELVNNTSATLSDLVKPTGMWRFVVKSGEKAQALLTVVKVGEEWKTVSISGADSSKEILAIANSFPEREGYTFRFVRIYQATSDLMEIRKGSKTLGFAPLTSALKALEMQNLGLKSNSLLQNYEVQKPMQKIVARVLKSDRKGGQGMRTEK